MEPSAWATPAPTPPASAAQKPSATAPVPRNVETLMLCLRARWRPVLRRALAFVRLATRCLALNGSPLVQLPQAELAAKRKRDDVKIPVLVNYELGAEHTNTVPASCRSRSVPFRSRASPVAAAYMSRRRSSRRPASRRPAGGGPSAEAGCTDRTPTLATATRRPSCSSPTSPNGPPAGRRAARATYVSHGNRMRPSTPGVARRGAGRGPGQHERERARITDASEAGLPDRLQPDPPHLARRRLVAPDHVRSLGVPLDHQHPVPRDDVPTSMATGQCASTAAITSASASCRPHQSRHPYRTP